MNTNNLHQAEARFLLTYPGGFEHPEIKLIAKKHKIEKMVQQTQEAFTLEKMEDVDLFCEHLIKVITGSSMVSLFDKPKFRDYIRSLDHQQRVRLSDAYKTLLYGDEALGFEAVVTELAYGKLASWSLVTAVLAYFRPDFDVFMKPTTVKGIIHYFELQDLTYTAKPNYTFYTTYRRLFNDMKHLVDPSLWPSNPAFSGFLMMAMEE
jgi:hypothetical protein